MMASKATVQQRLEALRVAGHPTSMAELDKRNRLPETAQNAADLYQRAFAAFVTLAEQTDIPLFARDALPERGAPLPDEIAAAISQYLAMNRECLSLLHEAGDVADCWYERDLAELVPNPRGLRSSAFLLRLNAVFQAYRGDADAALLSIRDGMCLADSLRRAPVLVTHLVRMNLHAVAIEALERTLSVTDYTDGQLGDMDARLAAVDHSLDLEEALVGERSFLIETHKILPPDDSSLLHKVLIRLPCVQRMGLIDCLDYIDRSIEASKLPGTPRLAKFQEMAKDVDRLSFTHMTIKDVTRWTTPLIPADLRFRTRLSWARTAMAVERYRISMGNVPERLEQLVPRHMENVPTAPFDGRPICYRRADRGYILYSVVTDSQSNDNEAIAGDSCTWCFNVAR
ncbi:MAG TPA: hypothetical protein PKN00_17500 [Sedimentisphaerales bacterium]|jgi:hypothetical protein|nr:hypothetical protein [Sedimentisphaerales bacterium]